MLKKQKRDNAGTLIQQIIDSGYEVSGKMKDYLKSLVKNISGRTSNFTENADKMSSDFRLGPSLKRIEYISNN
jgi:hypothetical protein